MKFFNFFSSNITIFILVIVLTFGMIEKKDIFQLFCDGVKKGFKIVISLFPTLLALLISVEMLQTSNVINKVTNIFTKLLPIFYNYKDLLPFILLRPISGSSSMAIGTNLMKKFGVDSKIGILTALIMGSTETTIYVVSVYGSKLKGKNLKPAIVFGLIGDLACAILSITFYNIFLK